MPPASMSALSIAFTPLATSRSTTSIPAKCIDCAACELACPVTAIYHEDALQGDARKFIEINANYYRQ